MKRSRHVKDTYTRMPKKTYLEGVKGKLVDDVGAYFTMIDVEGSKGNMVGFWGSARLIFPVIEAVAKTIYRNGKGHDVPVTRLLKQLDIPYPDVVWEMYRNSLAHTDHLGHISKGTRTINWSITASAGGVSAGHFFKYDQVHIDTRRLYEVLLTFLDEQITEATSNVYVQTGISVGRKYQGRLGTEIDNFPS